MDGPRMTVEVLFWFAVCGVLYPYVGYPVLLAVLAALKPSRDDWADLRELPAVSLIVPVHNEEVGIARKIANTASLRYPADRLQVLFVSDGSTDRTADIIRAACGPHVDLVELDVRRGKAAALNAGLERARHEILVFSDASIDLEPDALMRIVRRFQDPEIGCVSGEDRIAESGGEAWYGRYELLVRRLESRVHSIVGASGSFYAQRRALCGPFAAGMAPDFLSVIRTAEQGYRAVADPEAVGRMTSAIHHGLEFERKVRTFIRGITTLFAHASVLNPFRFGVFAFEVFSHKLMRWMAPFFLVATLTTCLVLLNRPLYQAALAAQLALYFGALAALGKWWQFDRSRVGRISLYFTAVNAAVLVAWFQYARGVRREVWTPTRRR
jgi:glycosyltransferase involved in cell wall biosynthesis